MLPMALDHRPPPIPTAPLLHFIPADVVRSDLPDEEWRPIPGHELTHLVSSHGRVWSLPRRRTKGGILNGLVNGDGYVVMYFPGHQGRRQHAHRVHVLVALAFHGQPPKGLEVRHLDGNGANNALSNLRYGTHSENMRDSVAHGTHKEARKTRCVAGHPLSGENLQIRGSVRVCRTCHGWTGLTTVAV